MSDLYLKSLYDDYGINTYGTEDGIIQFKVLSNRDSTADSQITIIDITHYVIDKEKTLSNLLGSLIDKAKENAPVKGLMSKISQDDRSKETKIKTLIENGFKIMKIEKDSMVLTKEL